MPVDHKMFEDTFGLEGEVAVVTRSGRWPRQGDRVAAGPGRSGGGDRRHQSRCRTLAIGSPVPTTAAPKRVQILTSSSLIAAFGDDRQTVVIYDTGTAPVKTLTARSASRCETARSPTRGSSSTGRRTRRRAAQLR